MELNKYIDHTNLKNTSTLKDIEKLCNEAIKYKFASVCVYTYYVPLAKSLLKDIGIKKISDTVYSDVPNKKTAHDIFVNYYDENLSARLFADKNGIIINIIPKRKIKIPQNKGVHHGKIH